MNNAENTTEAMRWLRYAREDLSGAEEMMKQDNVFARHVCWLAQQAAEKAIKAGLVFLQTDFPKTHDLDALQNLLPDGWRSKTVCTDLADLTEWAVEARYPGDWPDATESDAAEALRQAGSVLQAIVDDLGKETIQTNES
ncbi:MAG: HEPN domain-containing protein [Phycisphaerae bacterium]|nr:HEPN domain-containing protein [Phycisphaerae bacterium]